MKFTDLLRTASSNMLRSKARAILTIIAIFIGAMTITLTNGIGTGIKGYLNQQLGDLGATNVLFITLNSSNTSSSGGPAKYTYSADSSTSSSGNLGQTQSMMNLNDIAIIKSIPGVTSVTPAFSPSPDYIQGLASKYQLAIQEQYGSTTAVMLNGSGVNGNVSQYQISIPASYVGPLGYGSNQATIGKTVTLGVTNAYGKQSTVKAVVTGVQQKNLLGQSSLYGNTALIGALNTAENVGIPPALANTFQTATATFPTSDTPAQISAIEDSLSAKGFSAKTIKDEESTIFTAVNAVIITLDLLGAIALLAASFGIVNTLLMSVQERTKEIGLMKALGMGRASIFTLFSIEAVLLGFWGSLLGIGFATLVGAVVNSIGKHSFLKNLPGLSLVTFPVSTVVTVIIVIMLIAFLAGTIPALRASKKDPIDALRYE